LYSTTPVSGTTPVPKYANLIGTTSAPPTTTTSSCPSYPTPRVVPTIPPCFNVTATTDSSSAATWGTVYDFNTFKTLNPTHPSITVASSYFTSLSKSNCTAALAGVKGTNQVVYGYQFSTSTSSSVYYINTIFNGA